VITIVALFLTAGLAGTPVASAASPPSAPLAQAGPNQEKGEFHVIDESALGFTLVVEYRRYQLIPENDVVANICRTSLTLIGRELGELRQRKIKPIDEAQVRVKVGRSGDMTTCSASVPVDYAD
jgi:hypothetical protein